MSMHTKGMSAAFLTSMAITAGASSYVTSWVGNTYGGGTTQNFVAQDVKEARVTRDGQFICGTWWDEGHREVAVYSKSGIRDLPTRTSTLAVATDQVNLYHAVKGRIVKYKLSSFELIGSVTASSSYIVGMDCHKNKVFVSIRDSNLIKSYDATTFSRIDSFHVAGPWKLAVDTTGVIWVVQDSTSSNSIGPGGRARVVGYRADGTKVAEVTDLLSPTAIAVDYYNRLLIGDSGPGREHVRIYKTDNKTPMLEKTFGRAVSAGIPGAIEPDKFCHITGVGRDTIGNWYIAWNGIETSDGEGSVIRCLSPAGSLLWEYHGLEFIDLAVLDPADEKRVLTKSEIFTMDYAKPAGKEWLFAAYTLDRHTYPHDVRIASKHSFVKQAIRYNGKLFTLLSDMWSNYKTVMRYEGNIAVPCVMFISNTRSTYPPNKPSGQSIWIDGLKGNPVDGNFQSGEFMVAPIGWSNIRLDSSCNVWAGQTRYNCRGLDTNGIPQYQVSDVTTFSIPSSDFVKVKGFEYVETENRLYVHGYTAQYPDSLNMASKPTAGRVMIRYDNWPEAPKRGATFVMPYTKIEYDMIRSISVAGDYVFGAIYGVWGRGTEVHVFNKMTGVRDTIMTPGPEVGKQSGMQDITPCILAFKRPSSEEYLVFVEEDWYAKVLMFRFRPSSVHTVVSFGLGQVHKEDFRAESFNLIGRKLQGSSIRGGMHGYKPVTNATGLHLSKKRQGTGETLLIKAK